MQKWYIEEVRYTKDYVPTYHLLHTNYKGYLNAKAMFEMLIRSDNHKELLFSYSDPHQYRDIAIYNCSQ